jgi:hypothetical protein
LNFLRKHMRPARLNEICEYKAEPRVNPCHAHIRPHLSSHLPSCMVNLTLDYVHDDQYHDRRVQSLIQHIRTCRAFPKNVGSWPSMISEGRAVKFGVRRAKSAGGWRDYYLVESEWGDLYGWIMDTPITMPPRQDFLRLHTPTLPGISFKNLGHALADVEGSSIDEWGTLWLSAT